MVRGGEMKRHLRIALTGAFLVAVAVVAVSAMAFTGGEASAVKPKPSANPKARTPAAMAEQIRVDRRDSYSRTGCKHRVRQVDAPDV
jgi:hypothetical protein